MMILPDTGRAMAEALEADRVRQAAELDRARRCPCARCAGDHPATVCPRS